MDRVRVVIAALFAIALVTTESRAGDVTATLSGGTLTLTAGPGDELIQVTAVDADSLTVTPTAPTTVNGSGDPQTLDGFTGGIVVALGLGNNQTTITGVTIPGALTVTGGGGG